MKGKLIRRSLKTNHITVAKLRLADLEKNEQQKAQSVNAVASGKMTFGDALAVFKTRMENNPTLKPRTKEYCAYRISALLKSWPALSVKDVSRISNAECLDWSVKNASRNSSSSHNYTVSILRRVFAICCRTHLGTRQHPAQRRQPPIGRFSRYTQRRNRKSRQSKNERRTSGENVCP